MIMSVNIKALNIYQKLKKHAFDVLLDDTDESPASKFKNFDLIGIPYQIIIGSKQSISEFEFKEVNGKKENLSENEIITKLQTTYFN